MKDRPLFAWIFAALMALFLSACADPMLDQGRLKPYEASSFFPDGRSARPLLANTIPYQPEGVSVEFTTGKNAAGELLASMPISMTLQTLDRGRQRYDIYCAPCHGYDGEGHGMIVQRGFSPPPSLHLDRLRQGPDGHFFDVITHGFGQMYPYADRLDPADRWAVVAYIRALQFSQNAPLQDLPADVQKQVQDGQP